MCPESIRLYALKGITEHAEWIAKADNVTVDAVRGSSFPVVCVSTYLQEAQDECAKPLTAAQERAMLDEDPEQIYVDPPFPMTPTPVKAKPKRPRSPAPSRKRLAQSPAAMPTGTAADLNHGEMVGKRVLVPATLWPEHRCKEHGGNGWEGTIIKATTRLLTVRYAIARTPQGDVFEDEKLPLDSVRLLSQV